ncbi:MAG: hypothetical protein OHK0019_06110 [Saprospiraceae bacterium]
MRYNVFLRAVPPLPGAWYNGNFQLGYDYLVVKVKLNLAAGHISAINETLTEATTCLASYFQNNASITFDAKTAEGEATLLVTSMTGEMLPGIPFSNYRSTEPLFQVFVDGFPGEEFGLTCAELSYTNDFYNCYNEPGPPCSGNATAPFPLPSTASSTILSLTADCNTDPLYMIVPVYVTNLPNTVNFMDFAVEIALTAANGVELDGLPIASGFINGIPSPNTEVKTVQSGTKYLLYAKYSTPFGITGQPSDPLFTIRIPKPEDLGETYTITATLKPGRIRAYFFDQSSLQSKCRSFFHSTGSVQCSNAGIAVCSDMSFIVEPSPVPPTECGKLSVYAKLNWNYSSEPTRDFESFKVLLEFDLQPGVTIASTTAVENMDCPATFDCPDGCLSISGNTVKLCFVTSNGVTLNQNSRIRVDFNGDGGCVMRGKARLVRVKRKDTPSQQYTECRPTLTNMGQFCPLKIEGDIAMENGCYVEDVNVTIASEPLGFCNTVNFVANQSIPPPSTCAVPYSKCLCSAHNQYKVTPTKDGNDLNGVSTFDLVLISKHILGIEPLGSPYKMIAADANKSNGLTTFDIVEFRKLILGIYDELPNNTSWRFVPKSHVFYNNQNPWEVPNNPNPQELPAFAIFQLPTTTADFVAIKVGDVNLTAATTCTENDCNAFQKPAGEAALSVPKHGIKAGDYYTLPLRAGGEIPLTAWQMALRFDAEALELVGPSLGDLPSINADNFGLTQVSDGLIRALWFAQPGEEESLKPGQTLFHLTFRAKSDIANLSALLSIDDEALASLGWQDDGTAYALRLAPVSPSETREQAAANPFAAICRPNPTSSEANFDLVMAESGKMRLSIYGAFGTRVFFREYSLEKGAHTLTVPEASEWPAGVYHWELRRGKERAQGTFIRQ